MDNVPPVDAVLLALADAIAASRHALPREEQSLIERLHDEILSFYRTQLVGGEQTTLELV